ncbi:MAG: hypothetical protein IKE51_03300, partial [Solobacterium sp.]|nr:hypothetical protein [Solobacterium sp.]
VPCVSSLSLLYLNFFKLHRLYHFEFKTTMIRIVKIGLSILALNGFFGALRLIDFKITNDSFAIQFLGIVGLMVISGLLYCFIISVFKLVEGIYETSFMKRFKEWNRTE